MWAIFHLYEEIILFIANNNKSTYCSVWDSTLRGLTSVMRRTQSGWCLTGEPGFIILSVQTNDGVVGVPKTIWQYQTLASCSRPLSQLAYQAELGQLLPPTNSPSTSPIVLPVLSPKTRPSARNQNHYFSVYKKKNLCSSTQEKGSDSQCALDTKHNHVSPEIRKPQDVMTKKMFPTWALASTPAPRERSAYLQKSNIILSTQTFTLIFVHYNCFASGVRWSG